MKDKSPKFFLYRGDTLLGKITHSYDDFPWHHGTFEPMPEFCSVKELFDQERTILEKKEFDGESWEKVWAEINRPHLRLIPVEGKPIKKLLIHIDGTETWWR